MHSDHTNNKRLRPGTLPDPQFCTDTAFLNTAADLACTADDLYKGFDTVLDMILLLTILGTPAIVLGPLKIVLGALATIRLLLYCWFDDCPDDFEFVGSWAELKMLNNPFLAVFLEGAEGRALVLQQTGLGIGSSVKTHRGELLC